MKAGLNQPRKHHFVPRVYLKNFAFQKKDEWSVKVIDKTKNQLHKANIKDIAVEKDFYRIDSKDDEFYWEYYYSEHIESVIPATFNSLIAICTLSVDKSPVLNSDMKLKLAKIICSQLLRTKKSREMHFDIGQRVANNVITKVKEKFKRLLSEENIAYLNNFNYDDVLNKLISLPIINEEERINRFINILLERYWVVYKNVNYRISPFITSDHPVVFYNIITRETDFSNNGLGVPQIAIFFPVNRQFLIGLYTESMYFNQMFELNDKMLIVDDIPFVMKQNRIQYEQCHRQAYFSLLSN